MGLELSFGGGSWWSGGGLVWRALIGVEDRVGICFVCGWRLSGFVVEIVAHWGWVLADRYGVVIGSDGFVNGFFLGGGWGGVCWYIWKSGLVWWFFLTWFCFWYKGGSVLTVLLFGGCLVVREVVCSLCCYLEVVWWWERNSKRRIFK